MKAPKYLIKVSVCLVLICNIKLHAQTSISPSITFQPQSMVTKSKLSDACHKTYSGSSIQIDDCMTCAKNVADINSKKFINCMNSFETINEQRYGQAGADDFISNTPNCIKGVKSFGC